MNTKKVHLNSTLNLEKLTYILEEYTLSKITYEFTTKWLLEMLYASYLYGILRKKDISKLLSYFNGTFFKEKNMEYENIYLLKREDNFANYGYKDKIIFEIDETKENKVPDFVICEIENAFSKTMKKVAKMEEKSKKYWKNQTFLYKLKYVLIVISSLVSLFTIIFFICKKINEKTKN